MKEVNINEEKIDVNEIVKIEQMPKVFSQLEKIGEIIKKKTSDLDKLECTEANKQEVKSRRTEINNTLALLEAKKKEIKNKLLEPYNVFEAKYNEECKEKLQNASSILTEKINAIEIQQKLEKEQELREFADEYFNHYMIKDVVKFEDIGLNITLSASIKSLKEQTKAFCERISNDLKLIDLEEYKDEIVIEYLKNLDFAKSKMIVIERHRQLEEIKKREEELKAQQEQEQEVVEKVEEVVEEIKPPVEIIDVEAQEVEEIFTATFTVKTTKAKLKALKNFMESEGIEYV
jgi:hypothetical protein